MFIEALKWKRGASQMPAPLILRIDDEVDATFKKAFFRSKRPKTKSELLGNQSS